MKIEEGQLRDEQLRDDMGPSARRAASGAAPGPREYTDSELGIDAGMQAPGRTDNSIVTDPGAMALQLENAGIAPMTGEHGETADPLARDITGAILAGPIMSGASMLLGRGVQKVIPEAVSTGASRLMARISPAASTAADVVPAYGPGVGLAPGALAPTAEVPPFMSPLIPFPLMRGAAVDAAITKKGGR